MIHLEVHNDKWMSRGSVPKLGTDYNPSQSGLISLQGQEVFPFSRACLSMGDWGIISGLPEALHEIYPNLRFELPSREWLLTMFQDAVRVGKWSFAGSNPVDNIDLIFKNNPYVTRRFDLGDYNTVIIDHARCNRFANEPLVEKILRYWGATEEQIKRIDSRPHLYFSREEVDIGDRIIEKYMGKNTPYLCFLLSARAENFKGEWPEHYDRHLREYIEEHFPGMPCFQFVDPMTIEDTRWANTFATNIRFQDIPECKDVRIQMYIKTKAFMNVGYQAGINDAVGRFSIHHYASPYPSMGDNVTRNNFTYYHPDGSIVKYL